MKAAGMKKVILTVQASCGIFTVAKPYTDHAYVIGFLDGKGDILKDLSVIMQKIWIENRGLSLSPGSSVSDLKIPMD
jgi:hypothetical protein